MLVLEDMADRSMLNFPIDNLVYLDNVYQCTDRYIRIVDNLLNLIRNHARKTFYTYEHRKVSVLLNCKLN